MEPITISPPIAISISPGTLGPLSEALQYEGGDRIEHGLVTRTISPLTPMPNPTMNTYPGRHPLTRPLDLFVGFVGGWDDGDNAITMTVDD